jgi:uncharacterized FlgJ-related protein
MKRTLLITIILFFAGLVAYAQQTGGSSQSSAQVKQTAQQSLTQGKTNFSQFQSTLDSLKTQNEGNDDAATYRRLMEQIAQLEIRIKKEQTFMQAKLDQGSKLSSTVVNQIQRLIDQYEAALADLEKFIAK